MVRNTNIFVCYNCLEHCYNCLELQLFVLHNTISTPSHFLSFLCKKGKVVVRIHTPQQLKCFFLLMSPRLEKWMQSRAYSSYKVIQRLLFSLSARTCIPPHALQRDTPPLLLASSSAERKHHHCNLEATPVTPRKETALSFSKKSMRIYKHINRIDYVVDPVDMLEAIRG